MSPARKEPRLNGDGRTSRQAIAHVLHEELNLDVLQADDAAETVTLCQSNNPALVLLETLLPGLDSFAAAADIRSVRPHAKVGLLTRHNQTALLTRARRARLNGFVLKQDGFEELNYAIRTMLKGGFYTPPSMSSVIVEPTLGPDPFGRLTGRERSVFILYAQGKVVKEIAAQRGLEIVKEYTDRISGARARRPGLDELMREARRGRFDVILVWASDRIARSVRHFLEVLDEFNRLKVEFVSFREQIDTGGPLGRAIVVIIGAIAELERNLIVERVRAGMRRARLEGRQIGRPSLDLDREGILRDRQRGRSIGQIAREHRVSRTTVHRVLHGHAAPTSAVPKGVEKPTP